MKSLTFGCNQFIGNIPLEIGQLSNIQDLDLAGNKLTGNIPPEMGNLFNLIALHLRGNQLKGKIPEEFKNLTQLKYFYIEGNFFEEMPALENVKTELSCFNNCLTFEDFERNLKLIRNQNIDFKYFPQSNFGKQYDTTAVAGKPFAITIPCGGIYNHYKWFKNNAQLTIAPDASQLTFPAIQTSDAGTYNVAVINDSVPNLTLTSYPVHINIKEPSISERDSLALVALYNATNGPNWTHKDNWLTGPVKTWWGIGTEGCDVIGINLFNNNLSGNIPSEIGQLKNLKRLNLRSNKLNGIISTQVGQLTNLIELDLCHNQITGEIPKEIGQLTNLIDLALNFNQLSGNIPEEICQLSNLMGLGLYQNQLSGNIPAKIGQLTNLLNLNLVANQLSGAIPAEIGQLTKLTVLRLSGNKLYGSIPSEIGKLTNLTILELGSNQLSGIIPPEIGQLTNLTFLVLGSNQLRSEIPSEIGKLTNLTTLNLGYNQFSGITPPVLCSLSNLRNLYLNNNQLIGSIPPELGNLPNLANLYIYNNLFGFNDISSSTILPNEIISFRYAPQAKQPAPTQTINGNKITLNVGNNHPANHYTWFSNGLAIAGNDANTFTFVPTAITTIYVRITNDVYTVPGNTYLNLILETEPIIVEPIIDLTPPTVIVRDITTQLNESGISSITATQVDNGSNDAFGIKSLVLDKTTFNCSNVGSNTVTLTVTDVNGNVSTATAIVTVQDKIAPALTVPANIIKLNDAGVCGAVLNIGQATASDNCSVATITNNAPAFFPVGITTVTWTTVDVNGNTTTSTQMVEITNNAPIISGVNVSPLVKLGVATFATASHADNNLVAANWSWGDDSSRAGTIAGTQISGSHVYSQTGLFNVTLTIEDACGRTDTKIYSYGVVFNPCNGFITGGGYITTPAGAYTANLTLSGESNYGFNAKYESGHKKDEMGEEGLEGEFNFHLKSADFKMKSTSLDWLMVNDDQAILKGSAKVNNHTGYHFIASIVDGGIKVKKGTDYLRLIVWDDAGNVLYDNQKGDPDNARASYSITKGQIVIHRYKYGKCDGDDYEDKDEHNHGCDMDNDNRDTDDHSYDDRDNENDEHGNNNNGKKPILVEMTVYPNPMVNNYQIDISIKNFGNTVAKVDLAYINGNMVYSIPRVQFIDGKARIDFRQAKLKTGNYMLMVSENGTSRVGVKQIIVLK